MFLARSLLAANAIGLAVLAGFGAHDANAQQVFRIVGPDGRVTFSDKPPMDPGTRAAPAKSVAISGGTNNSALPFELRQAASRYPVTLYTAPECGPCGAGRAMLSARGIPFSEKTVTTRDDVEALTRVAGSPSLPFLTIGGQQLKGFSEPEWVQFLDAAGYPQSSQLPAGYVQRPATPLVTAQDPAAARPAAAQQQPSPGASPSPNPSAAAPAPPPPAENPAGIKF